MAEIDLDTRGREIGSNKKSSEYCGVLPPGAAALLNEAGLPEGEITLEHLRYAPNSLLAVIRCLIRSQRQQGMRIEYHDELGKVLNEKLAEWMMVEVRQIYRERIDNGGTLNEVFSFYIAGGREIFEIVYNTDRGLGWRLIDKADGITKIFPQLKKVESETESIETQDACFIRPGVLTDVLHMNSGHLDMDRMRYCLENLFNQPDLQISAEEVAHGPNFLGELVGTRIVFESEAQRIGLVLEVGKLLGIKTVSVFTSPPKEVGKGFDSLLHNDFQELNKAISELQEYPAGQ